MVERLIMVAERNAAERLAEFVREARYDCAAFGTDLDWLAPDWDITAHCPPAASKSRRRSVIYFTTHENGTAKGIEGRTPMQEPFASFAKAVIRRKQDGKPVTLDPLARIVNAARDLHDVLAHKGHDPVALTSGDFDEAARRVELRSNASTAYRLGQSLEELARIIDRHGLSRTRLEWRSPIRKAHNRHSRTSPEADVARETKLPSPYVLDVLGELSHRMEDPSDVVLMGCIKLLHCAPWRIGEVLLLAADCEVEEQKIGPNGPVHDEEGRPVMRYGVRYRKEKSLEADIKWMPTVMADVARAAIAQIRSATADARGLAAWMDKHPGRARLPGPDHGPDQLYGVDDVVDMVGLANPSAGTQWIARHCAVGKVDTRYRIRRADLEAALVRISERAPKDDRGMPLSRHLFLTFRNLHHAERGTNRCALGLTKDQQVADFLSGRESARGRTLSVFAKFGRTMPNGSPIEMTSHMFRHWLNTLAQAAGLDQALIARWSGRDDAGQNADYDHVSGIELARRVRGMMEDGRVFGALANVHAAKPPVVRAAFRENVFATAHVTEIGMCDLDWITSSCPEFNACETCEHCLVVKGDPAARERTAHRREQTEWLLRRSEEEIDDGTINASNHAASQKATLEAIDRILVIHDDPSIPDGTLIQPIATSPDHYAGPPLPGAA